MIYKYYYISFDHCYVRTPYSGQWGIDIKDSSGPIRSGVNIKYEFRRCKYYKDSNTNLDLFVKKSRESKGFILTLNTGGFLDRFIPFELFKWLWETDAQSFKLVRTHSFPVPPPKEVHHTIREVLGRGVPYKFKIISYYRSPHLKLLKRL